MPSSSVTVTAVVTVSAFVFHVVTTEVSVASYLTESESSVVTITPTCSSLSSASAISLPATSCLLIVSAGICSLGIERIAVLPDVESLRMWFSSSVDVSPESSETGSTRPLTANCMSAVEADDNVTVADVSALSRVVVPVRPLAPHSFAITSK